MSGPEICSHRCEVHLGTDTRASLIEMATEFPPGNSLNYCPSPNPPKLYQRQKNLLGVISASVDMKMKEKWSTDIKISRQIFLAHVSLRSPFTAGDMLDYGRIYFQVLNKANGHINYNSMRKRHKFPTDEATISIEFIHSRIFMAFDSWISTLISEEWTNLQQGFYFCFCCCCCVFFFTKHNMATLSYSEIIKEFHRENTFNFEFFGSHSTAPASTANTSCAGISLPWE